MEADMEGIAHVGMDVDEQKIAIAVVKDCESEPRPMILVFGHRARIWVTIRSSSVSEPTVAVVRAILSTRLLDLLQVTHLVDPF